MSSDGSGGGLSPIGGGLRPIGGGGNTSAPGTIPPPPPTAAPGNSGLSGVGAGLSSLNPVAPAPVPASLNPAGGVVPQPIGGIAPPGMSPPPASRPAAPGAYTPPVARPAAARPAAVPTPSYAEEEGSGAGKIIKGIIGGVVALLAVGLYFLMRPAPSAAIPTAYTQFASADNSFTCDGPEGWDKRASGAASGDEKSVGQNGVYFTSGGAGIEITISNVSDLLAAQLMFGNEVVPEAMTGSRANGLHKMNRKSLSKRFKGYKEKDALPPGFAAAMAMGGVIFADLKAVPDFKLSEWTATGNVFGFGGAYHGYRASLAGGKILASGICYCSEKDWPQLKGPFLKVLSSVRETRQPGSNGPTTLGVPGAGSVTLPGSGG